jgi:hypothetical protein
MPQLGQFNPSSNNSLSNLGTTAVNADVNLTTGSNLKFPASGGAKGYMVASNNTICMDVSGRTLACTTEDIVASWDNAIAQFTVNQLGVIQQSPQVQNAATAVGSLTKKIQVYNENGTLLGYIPVYTSIA